MGDVRHGLDRESAYEELAASTGATSAPDTPPAEPVPPQQAPQEAPPQAPPPAEDEGPGFLEKAVKSSFSTPAALTPHPGSRGRTVVVAAGYIEQIRAPRTPRVCGPVSTTNRS